MTQSNVKCLTAHRNKVKQQQVPDIMNPEREDGFIEFILLRVGMAISLTDSVDYQIVGKKLHEIAGKEMDASEEDMLQAAEMYIGLMMFKEMIIRGELAFDFGRVIDDALDAFQL